MPKRRAARETDDPAPVRESGTSVREERTIPPWLEPYRGTRGRIFQDLGNEVIERLHQLFDGNPSSVAEFLGVHYSNVGKRFGIAGLQTRKRDPWLRFQGDASLADKRGLYLKHCSRIETALRFALKPDFGEKADPYATLICVSDLHFGSSEFDYPRFLKLRDWIGEHPQVGVGILGDLWDLKTAQSPGVQYGGVALQWEDCREILTEDLRPIAPQIRFVLRGNHDDRVARTTKVGIDQVADLCRELSLPYLGYEGYCIAEVGPQRYTLYVHHGCGSGQTKGAIWNTLERLARNNQVDAVVMGHRHHHGADTYATRVVAGDDEVGVREVPLVCAGSFQRSISGSYAVDRNMTPAVLGAATLHLYAKRKSVHPRT